MASALNGFQESTQEIRKKRRRVELPPLSPTHSDGFSNNDITADSPASPDIELGPELPTVEVLDSPPRDDLRQVAERRPVRQRKANVLYKDFVDSREEFGNIAALDAVPTTEASLPPPILGNASLGVCSVSDTFGLRRFYYEKPTHSPHPIALLQPGVTVDLELIAGPSEPTQTNHLMHHLGPHKNESELLLVDWFSRNPRNTIKSFSELRSLFDNPRFKPEQLPSANVMISHLSSLGELGSPDGPWPDWLEKDAGWKRSSVTITVPFVIKKVPEPVDDHRKFTHLGVYDTSIVRYDHGGPQEFIVNDFYHRSLVDIVRSRLRSRAFQQMHIHPYDLRWIPGEGKAAVRVYGEMYTSLFYLKEHIKLQNSAPRPHQYPRVILALIYFLDGTQLASFGDANFWPGYLQLGNNSKYDRMKPSLHMTEHFAYFRKLPPSFKAFIHQHNGGLKSISQVLTHSRRELFHAQWKILLDDEFVEAYENGILEECYDGVTRLFFPRIYVYAADYLEKVLISTIKYLSTYPCPECYVEMEDVALLGTPEDMATRSKTRVDDEARVKRISIARNAVYNGGKSLQSKTIEKYLKMGSYTLTENAFSKRLRHLGFNYFTMFRNEVLHEWSSNGEGKKMHVHLLRILDTIPSNLAALDSQFRDIPTFGKDGIRKFRRNVSEMSFQAARDIEDIIQCALPVYEGLLPEPYNTQILDLLYTMAEWQALAKLRLHTDHTLHLLDQATSQLGEDFRCFVKDMCPNFKTMELKHEVSKRARRAAKVLESKDEQDRRDKKTVDTMNNSKSLDGSGKSKTVDKRIGKQKNKAAADDPSQPSENAPAPTDDVKERRECVVSLRSYKLHALGHVANSIRDLGTTESYSSEFGEAEHRTGKRRYLRTDGKDYTKQLAQHDRREARLRRIRNQLDEHGDKADLDFLSLDTDLSAHHEMGKSQNKRILLSDFASKHRGDPAAWDFIPRLKKHLLPRIMLLMQEEALNCNGGDFTKASSALQSLDNPPDHNDHLLVVFQNSEAIYQHNVLRVNYTAYDTRRQQDVLNPGTDHKDIMLLSGSNMEPRYRYARVIGVFHCNIRYNGPSMPLAEFRRLEFLWVRWFRTVTNLPKRLECLEFVPFEDNNSVGFLDPHDIIRAAHIIPRSSKGYAHPDRKGCSRLCHDSSDYLQYCVGRFSDKDLYMHWLWGLGVGHKYSHPDAPDRSPPRLENQRETKLDAVFDEIDLALYDTNDPEALAEDDTEGELLEQAGGDNSDPLGLLSTHQGDSDDENGMNDFDEGFIDDDDLDDETFYARGA